MQYVILVYENEEAFAARSDERAGAYWGAYQAYSTAMREAGISRGGNGLQGPPTATSVRLQDGERLASDWATGAGRTFCRCQRAVGRLLRD